MDNLISKTGMSARTFRRQFTAQAGIGPKYFESDQPHMVQNFQEFAGLPFFTRRSHSFRALVSFMTLLLPLCATLAFAAEPTSIANLSFMSGCWEVKEGPMLIEEQWSKPAGDTMPGLSRTLKSDKTVFSEFMRIEKAPGGFAYRARILPGQPGTLFKMIRSTETEVVFENPTHDFRRRILYRKTEGGLFARIEGVDKGKPRGVDFPMTATSCKY